MLSEEDAIQLELIDIEVEAKKYFEQRYTDLDEDYED